MKLEYIIIGIAVVFFIHQYLKQKRQEDEYYDDDDY